MLHQNAASICSPEQRIDIVGIQVQHQGVVLGCSLRIKVALITVVQQLHRALTHLAR